VRERLKRQSWKDCVSKGTRGSNPLASAYKTRLGMSLAFCMILFVVYFFAGVGVVAGAAAGAPLWTTGAVSFWASCVKTFKLAS
jgi:hypothetical protein